MSSLAQTQSLPCILPGTTIKQAIGSASAATAALTTDIVRLAATTDCYVVFGATPVATSSGLFLPAGCPEYFAFISGQKIAVIRDTTDGNLLITPAQ